MSYNKQLKAVLAANNAMLYSTENEEKSSVVEWGNRRMKNIMWKYFTAYNTQKYIDVLPSMVERYNSTFHRSIKLTLSDARNPTRYQHVHNAKVNARKATSPKFHVGDKVRIPRKKDTFEKGFTPNWTEEVFTINSVKATKPPTYTTEIRLENQFKGPFTSKNCNRVYRKSFVSNECSRRRKNKYLSCGNVTVGTINRP